MFGNDFKRILEEYNIHKNEDYVDNSFAGEMRREFRDNLKNSIVKFVDINKYKVKISPGQNEWVEIPWAGIRNIDVAPSFQEGFYVVYLFRKDMSGYYLSLNQGVTNIKRNRSEILKSRADELKKELNDIPTGFSIDPLILNGTKSYSKLYEIGNIISKFYSINDAIDENQLIKDLENILGIYESLMPIYEKIINIGVQGRLSDYYNKEPKTYWVTVGKTLQSNYRIGMDNHVWGIKEDYKNKASKLKEGDYLLIYSASFGFTLCKIESETYENDQRLWPDDIYPIRFKISDPIYQESLKPDNIHECLRDAKGIPYKSGSAWGRAIGGSGGILRELKPNEIECLFDKLEWNHIESDTPINVPDVLFLNPKDMDPEIKLKNGVLDNICALLNSGKHILLTGPPGTGKTDLAKYIANEIVKNGFSDGYILTTATSDWTTFDTIGGYMPDNNGDSLSFYEGKFLQAIRENKILLIDEINRSDIDKAFGQLFTVLSGQGVEIPFILNSNHVKILPNNGEINSCRNEVDSSYIVGKNWRIISTMNVFDKNYLFEMSYAFMRRFAFIYIDLPEDDDYKYLIREKWAQELDEGYIKLIEELLNINKHRPLGPAIFKDICEFVKNRVELLDDPEESINNKILIDAFISFIIPQFEGLEISELENIWEILDSYIKNDIETQLRFEEMGFFH